MITRRCTACGCNYLTGETLYSSMGLCPQCKEAVTRPISASSTTDIDLDKPPIGIQPERDWQETRIWDLIECLARHRNQSSVRVEWFNELRRLLNEVSLG